MLDALGHALAVVARPEVAERWADDSALAGMTVGGLVGHLLQTIRRAEATLDGPSPPGALGRPVDWYGANRATTPADVESDEVHRFIRDDGERVAGRGRDAVIDHLERVVERLPACLAANPAGRTVEVWRTKRAVPLADYLASRVVELLVHADDVAASVGLEPPDPPPEAAAIAERFLLDVARGRAGDTAVLRALTRAERDDDPGDVLRVL
ncbi:MAG: maleylpyruvate isomerase N-terminal domain-containing protein [Acidimicrobiales bacterium]